MLVEVTEQLASALLAQGKMLTTAESCTGGWVAEAITAISGSSQWFERGFITYSNLAKVEMLGVSQESLAKFGAVSEQTAKEMAEGALQNSHAQVAIATTGIAGPIGGTTVKPVGTIWFAWAFVGAETKTVKQLFKGDRQAIRKKAVAFALQTLLQQLA